MSARKTVHTPPMPSYPFKRAMEFGLGTLGLSSREFWEMTPRELAAAFAGHYGPQVTKVMSRETFMNLQQKYPDGGENG